MINRWLWGWGKLLCSFCQFLWCDYSHSGQIPAANVKSLNTELERDAYNRLSQDYRMSWLRHTLV